MELLAPGFGEDTLGEDLCFSLLSKWKMNIFSEQRISSFCSRFGSHEGCLEDMDGSLCLCLLFYEVDKARMMDGSLGRWTYLSSACQSMCRHLNSG